jgi:glycosyltransferase involved in cell wall biosynthesis
VVTVLPPPSTLDAADALAAWPTSTLLLEALAATGRVDAVGVARGPEAAEVVLGGVHHVFAPTERDVVRAVRDAAPDVVHVHGTGFVGLVARLRAALGADVPLLLQHHGEPPGPFRNRLAHRVLRRSVAGWMFTGAHHGQAEPFRAAGAIGPATPLFEVLEAADTLPLDDDAPPMPLEGTPSVLWVGRMTAGKDPLMAVRALALCTQRPDAHLHLLVTDRSLADAATVLAERLDVTDRVHLRPSVPRAEMHRWYQGADVLLSTSRREGSNYSLIEALHRGCTPVVTAIAPHEAIVGDLAPRMAVGDAAGAAALLARPLLDRGLVTAAARARLGWDAVAHQALDAYEAAVSSARRS